MRSYSCQEINSSVKVCIVSLLLDWEQSFNWRLRGRVLADLALETALGTALRTLQRWSSNMGLPVFVRGVRDRGAEGRTQGRPEGAKSAERHCCNNVRAFVRWCRSLTIGKRAICSTIEVDKFKVQGWWSDLLSNDCWEDGKGKLLEGDKNTLRHFQWSGTSWSE